MQLRQVFWVFCLVCASFYLVKARYVFIDSSGDKCMGCTSNVAYKQNLTNSSNFGDNRTHFSCLKDCVLQRAKTAVYRQGQICLCTNDTYTQTSFEVNRTCCLESREKNVVKQAIKIYNLTGFIVQLRFDEYVEQNKIAVVDPQVLLCDQGGLTSDMKILKQLSNRFNCTVYTSHTKVVLYDETQTEVVNNPCWAGIAFSKSGVNKICIGDRPVNADTACGTVKVLAPLILEVNKESGVEAHYPLETKFKVTVTGTVFNLSCDFGDGKGTEERLVEPNVYQVCVIHLSIGHNYSAPGEYNFTVRASNPLHFRENVKRVYYKFGLQISYELLQWENDGIVVLVHAEHYHYGKKLTYKWTITPRNHICSRGNVSSGKTSGPSTKVRFPSIVEMRFCSINVVLLTEDGVELSSKRERFRGYKLFSIMCGQDQYIPTQTKITCQLVHRPPKKGKMHTWTINGKKFPGNETFHHVFRRPGSYDISIVDSNVTSRMVIVQDKMSNLIIRAFPSTVGSSVTFVASSKPAENVSYEWHFGDGRTREFTKNSEVTHTYENVVLPRNYQVNVIAKNEVSNMSKSINITVTAFCFEVKTSFENNSKVEVHRSRPIHLELGIKYLVECAKYVPVKFIWKMFQRNSSGWTNIPLENQNVSKTTFGIYIPPNVLDFKTYQFRVTVNVTADSNRIVKYPKEFSTMIKVIRTPLKAIIRGGLVRYVSSKLGTVRMDASLSTDPDYPERTLTYTWTCTIEKSNSSCLNSYDLSMNTGAVLDIPVSRFKVQNSSGICEFDLTVSDGNGKRSHTYQLLNFNPDMAENVILDCPSCDEGFVDPSKPTAIIRKCIGCDTKWGGTWKVAEIGDMSGYSSVNFKKIKCVDRNWELAGEGRKSNDVKISHLNADECEDSASVSANRHRDIFCSKLTFDKRMCQKYELERQLNDEDLPYGRDSPMLIINKNVLPSNTLVLFKSIFNENAVASRYVFVQVMPPLFDCNVHPKTGEELRTKFHLVCSSHVQEGGPFIYKVVFERVNDDGTRLPNIFFQGFVDFLTFQLPSGSDKTVRYSLRLWIANQKGVEREYCSMRLNVSAFNPDPPVTIEEYLYNQSISTKEMFHGHKYAYHGPTLLNVTVLAEILNRQPKASINSAKFHLRTETRMHLIDVLRRAEVTSEYTTRQFANSLESCTRVPEELNNVTTVVAIEALGRVLAEKNSLYDQRIVMQQDVRDNFVNVATSLLKNTVEHRETVYGMRIVNILESLFKVVLKAMKVDEKPITITKHSFNTTLLKVSPYSDESRNLTLGNVYLTFSKKAVGKGDFLKSYCVDVYGYGVQAMTLNIDNFDRNASLLDQISPVVKFNTYNCEGGDDDIRITGMKIGLPRIRTKFSVPKQLVNYTITPSENHRFELEKMNNSALQIDLILRSPTLRKFKLRMNLSCVDRNRFVSFSLSVVAHKSPLRRIFSRERLDNCPERINVSVDIHWIIPANRVEQVETVVSYNILPRWISCLAWDNMKKQWSENYCTLDGYPSSNIKCSCVKTARDVMAATRPSPFGFETVRIPRETNGVMWIFILSLMSFCVLAIIAVFFLEKHEQGWQRSYYVLTPSDSSHTHKYQVTVYTGHVFGAGTTAKVGLVLFGEDKSSFPVEIPRKDYPLFRRNSRDIFIVSVRGNLGPLTGIHIWHDNSGTSPSWFIEKLIIKDLVSGQKWMFKCCRWLAMDKHDRKLDCKVKRYDGQDQLNVEEFWFEFGKRLMDLHLWLSLIGMPSYSLFRRTERLSCCMLVAFGYLCFNALFWSIRDDVLTVDCISIFNPTWMCFEIGVLSALVVFPFYLFFTVMFRFTKSTQTRKVSPFNSSPGDDFNKEQGKGNFPPLEKCASVMQELRYRSKQYMQRNKVEPSQSDVGNFVEEVEYPAVERSDEGESGTAMEAQSMNSSEMDSTTDPPSDFGNFDHEITSQGSGSYVSFRNSEKFRFPVCFRILIWIAAITMSVLVAYFAIQYSMGFDMSTLICYLQSVCWSLLLSFCVFQPLQALFATVVSMVHRQFIFKGFSVDDHLEDSRRGREAVVITGYTYTDTTDQELGDVDQGTIEDFRHLQPPSKKELSKARASLRKQNQAVAYIRDLLLYSFLMVLLHLMISSADQQSIFLHRQGLKDFFTSRTNTSSVQTWWSSSAQRILDTLEYGNLSGSIAALHGRAIIVGNPKVKMTVKYCKNMSNEDMINSSRTCAVHKEEETITFDKSLEDNWMDLSELQRQLTRHVKAISLEFVIYSPSLDVFSVLKLSCKSLLAANVQYDFAIKTFRFYVDGVNGNIIHTICQVLFTVVPILLIMRQVSCTQKSKFRLRTCVQVEFLIIFLSLLSFVVMWKWIKSQYVALALLRHKSFEADLNEITETIDDYQESLWLFLGLLQFLVFFKFCNLVGLGKLLSYYGIVFSRTVKLILGPLFFLVVFFISFTHVGLLLFGDYLKSFATFIKAFSLNIIYLREIDNGNLYVENREEQTILVLYVVAFCIFVGTISLLIKAAVCQAHLYCILTVKREELSVKTLVITAYERVQSLIRSFSTKSNQRMKKKEEGKILIPFRYIVKEVNGQLEEIEFRLVNLFASENMPPKNIPVSRSSSSELIDEVERIYKVKYDVESDHSYDGLPGRSDPTTGFSLTMHSSHAQEEISQSDSDRKTKSVASVSRRNHPFECATRDFPKPISVYLSPSNRSQASQNSCSGGFSIERKQDDLQKLIPETSKCGKRPHNDRFRRPAFPVPIHVLFNQSTRIDGVGPNSDNSDAEVSDI